MAGLSTRVPLINPRRRPFRLPLIALLAAAPLALSGCGERRPDPFPGGDDRSALSVEGEVFTGYGYAARSHGAGDSETVNAFFVDRAELGVGYAAASDLGAELRLEAVRTAEAGSYIGVAGNSLVMRVRRARGFYYGQLGPVGLDVELGLTRDPWLEALLPRFHLRASGALLAEQFGLFDANELGAVVGLRFLDDMLTLALGASNGEGRAEGELNAEKNFTARLTFEVPVTRVGGAPLYVGLHGVARLGSEGPEPDPARNDRIGGALTVDHPDYGLGAMYLRATGIEGRSDEDGEAIEVWGDARLVAEWLGVAVRWSRFDRRPEGGAVVGRQRLSAGLFGDLNTLLPGLSRTRLYLLYDDEQLDPEASTVPGLEEQTTGIRLVLEVAGSRRF